MERRPHPLQPPLDLHLLPPAIVVRDRDPDLDLDRVDDALDVVRAAVDALLAGAEDRDDVGVVRLGLPADVDRARGKALALRAPPRRSP
jgi:hypothetical protein